MIRRIREIYRYRAMLWGLVMYDLRTRYKGSILGFLWTFLNPLLLLVIYTVVFSTVMRVSIPHYPVVLFISLLAWNLFAIAVQSSAGIVLRQAGFVKKIYFPREILPLAVVGGNVVNYVFSLAILIPVMFIFGYFPTVYWFYLPLVLAMEIVMTAGFSLLFAALTVYFRDLEHIIGVFMMAWFYITPVVYTLTMIPAKYGTFFKLNPVTSVVVSYQQILYFEQPLRWKLFVYGVLFSFGILAVGWTVFNRLSRRFAEEV
jgi:ABC-2 type transport system permease protein